MWWITRRATLPCGRTEARCSPPSRVRGFHSSTPHLILTRFCHRKPSSNHCIPQKVFTSSRKVDNHFSAQPEPLLSLTPPNKSNAFNQKCPG
jgi:hypothetical protein